MSSEQERIERLLAIIESQDDVERLYKKQVENKNRMISALDDIIKLNNNVFCSIGSSYMDLCTRFSLELAKPFDELVKKTDDLNYVKEFTETYVSIMSDVKDLQEAISSFVKQSIENQPSLNE